MALIPREGSNAPITQQQNQQTPTDVTNILDQAPFIKNALVNRTAFNPDTYNDEFKFLQGYLEGARVNVTYFLRNTGQDDRRTDSIDVSTTRNTIHQNYTCINDFEITLTDGILMNYDENSTEANITGQAMLYPGVNPNLGDVFIFTLTDGKFAECVVDTVKPMSMRQLRNHEITFNVRNFATQETVQLLIDSSTAITYFDKTVYFSGTSTLLYADSYNQLITLRQMRSILAKYYYTIFYDETAAAIMSNDGLYDPYLTKFLTSKISFDEVCVRPTQLPIDTARFRCSLWGRLLDRFNASVSGLFASYQVNVGFKKYTDVYITGLLNKPILSLDWGSTVNSDGTVNNLNDTESWRCPNEYIPPGEPIYVFTTNFYTGNTASMTLLEELVYIGITQRTVTDINAFINLLNQYMSLSQNAQFYTLPLYIFLIDLAIETITLKPTANVS